MSDEQELIRRIASVVGHELRNPLAVLNNSAYFLKAKLGGQAGLDPKVEKHLNILASEVARADRMIGDILTYSRVMEPQKTKVGLGAAVKAAVEALGDSGKTVSVKAPKADPEVTADPKLVGDAVRKLLENAVEAAGPDGKVTVTVGKDFIEVLDSGPGVKAELLPHLFEPFRTTKPKGLGLGLALVLKVAKAHGGRAEGENAKCGGARFRLTLP